MPRTTVTGKLRVRSDIHRPYYYIRVTIPIEVDGETRMVRRDEKLGHLDEVTPEAAEQARLEALDRFNAIRRKVLGSRRPRKKARTRAQDYISEGQLEQFAMTPEFTRKWLGEPDLVDDNPRDGMPGNWWLKRRFSELLRTSKQFRDERCEQLLQRVRKDEKPQSRARKSPTRPIPPG